MSCRISRSRLASKPTGDRSYGCAILAVRLPNSGWRLTSNASASVPRRRSSCRNMSTYDVSKIEDHLKAQICAALAGDANTYRRFLHDAGILLRSYYAHRLGRASADVEDLVQETLLALHTKRLTYDSTKPVTPWLHAI